MGGMFSSRFNSAMAFSWASLVMPAVSILLLQLVELALFAAAELLLDGLDLLVEVILFLRLFHLALHAALDGAVDIELFDLDVQHFGHARQPVDGIEDFEQLLLFLDGQLQIRAYRVGQFARLVHADGRDHRFVVQVLAELDVLFEQAGDARHQRFQLRACVHLEVERLDYRPEVAFIFADRNDLAALDAFHQHLDIAVRQLQALDDVRNRADAIDLIGAGFVDRGVVLGGEENLLVATPTLLPRPARSNRAPPRRGSSCTGR